MPQLSLFPQAILPTDKMKHSINPVIKNQKVQKTKQVSEINTGQALEPISYGKMTGKSSSKRQETASYLMKHTRLTTEKFSSNTQLKEELNNRIFYCFYE